MFGGSRYSFDLFVMYGIVSSEENEKGLLGMSGVRGLRAFANNSSSGFVARGWATYSMERDGGPDSCCAWI